MQKWTIEDLKTELQKQCSANVVEKWRIRRTETQRNESYIVQDKQNTIALDQERFVKVSSLMVRIDTFQDGNKLGAAESQLYFNLDLDKQVQKLIDAASVGREEPWSLAEFEKADTETNNKADPAIWDNILKVSENLRANLSSAVKNTDTGEFNSAEIFVTKESEELILSNGFSGKENSSSLYSELCFSQKAQDKDLSEEFLLTEYVASPEQVDYRKMCQNSSDFARYSLDTEKPQSGKIATIIDQSVISQLLSDVAQQLGAPNKYFSLPFIPKGEEFIANYAGTPFELYLDPGLKNSFASRSYSLEGLPQKRICLMKDNQVLENITTKKMADYLNLDVTTVNGAFVVETQGEDIETLRKSSDQVLEILQFSGLFSSAMDLTFSSEIRLARLYDNKNNTVKYIKGGSLSGNFMENFAKVRWSSQSKAHNQSDFSSNTSYFGPEYALLNDVSISS